MLIARKLRSFGYAITGIKIAWREEFNFRVDVVCAIVTLTVGWFLSITRTEWMFVIAMIGFVLAAETFNTALEEFCDMVKSEHDPHIAKIKDLAAGATLVAAITAFCVGCDIFIPHFLTLFSLS